MINGDKITFATNCYEKNIDKITSPEFAKKLFYVGNDCIDYRILTVGNVSDKNKAKEKCEALKSQGIIDEFFFGYDYFKKIKKSFKGCGRLSFIRSNKIRLFIGDLLKRKKFRPYFDGIKYSISPMTACFVCPSKWLLWNTEDVELHFDKIEEWVSKSIDIMNKNDKVLISNPMWGEKESWGEQEKINRQAMQDEAVSEDSEFWYSELFSDHCFLIDADRVRMTKEIFGEKNDFCKETYPMYAGNSFEQRICAYMRNHNLVRAVYKNDYYVHLLAGR